MQKKRLQRILVTLVLIGIVAAAAAVLTPQAQGTELQLSPRPFTSASQQASSAQASLKLNHQ